MAEQLDELVGRLYELSLDPAPLPDVVDALTTWVDGGTCHLVGCKAKVVLP